MRRQNLQSYGGSFAWGGVILFIGVVLLLDHMGVVSAEGIGRFWPMILIVFGIVNLLDECKRIWGVCLLLAGLLLQLGQFGLVHVTWALLWPILVIGVGLSLMWGSMKARRSVEDRGETVTGPGALNELAIFSGVEKRIMGKNFRGGRLVAIFGGIEIDLWQAEMEGDTAVLHVDAIFGGVELRVPYVDGFFGRTGRFWRILRFDASAAAYRSRSNAQNAGSSRNGAVWRRRDPQLMRLRRAHGTQLSFTDNA